MRQTIGTDRGDLACTRALKQEGAHLVKFFRFFALGLVSTVLENDEFGVFDERVGFLRVG
jgi:hypothetical protein